METLTISLPTAMKEFVETEAQAAGFGSADEFLRKLIRDEEKRRARARIDALLMEGLASGPPIEATEEFWERLHREIEEGPGKADK